ncbi:TadE/TadG family protein [Qipengyuania sp. 6D47A]|uniref:TadE/TadG family protein n=2 Tax=Qipengyuania qiaonensis TaxID=2867240 RepID=A0ABS7J142_9SPHN|nr:TadE/TadG family protein [Qipengyuania qiaonensis]
MYRLFARLLNDNKGNVLPIVGAALVPLLMMIGSGVDLSRAYMAKSKMQSACDAASLAARRVMKSDTLNDEVTKTGKEFFNFNYPQGYYGASTFEPVVSKPAAGVIRVNASTTVPTTIMRIFGFATLPVAVNCDAELNFVNTDIVLVLDVTGSMAQNVDGAPKIDALRDAVMALYDELAPIQAQLAAQGLRLRYGIVPYSSTVNVGRLIYGQNANYMRSSTSVPSRVANFNNYAVQNRTNGPGSWEVYGGGSLTNGQCQTYVTADPVPGGGPPPTATTAIKYQGTASSEGYVQSQNWGYSGASDTSGSGRSCRRWRFVETTTYDANRRQFSNWTYQHVSYDVSNYMKPVSSSIPSQGKITYAKDATGTIPAPNKTLYINNMPSSVTGGSSEVATWNGCIEERDTVTTIDGGASYTIPSGAHDLDINLIPNSDATRWRPMMPDLIYARNAGNSPVTPSETDVPATSTAGWIKNNTPESGYWACPTEARRLAVWDRTALDTYVKSLQTVGGTYHDIGMIWGARFISRGGIFGDSCDVFNGMPCNRHIIFMTDGAQTAYCNVYGAYGVEANDMRVKGATNCTSDSQTNSVTAQLVARHEQRFRMACNEAKNTDTSVWVIGFDTALSANLTGCASTQRQADTVANRAALIAKFREIGNQIGALRLTQ